MAQIDTISKELCKRYKDDCEALKKKPGYLYIQHGQGMMGTALTLKEMRALKFKALKHKMKNFHVVSVDPVQSDQIMGFCFNIGMEKRGKKQTFKTDDMTGVFKMTFSDGSFMYFAKWIQGFGRNQDVIGLYAAEKETWTNYFKLVNKSKRYKLKPKNGVFKIEIVQTPFGAQLVYTELKKLNASPIIHPEVDIVLKDINFFFDNLPMFSRFGRSPQRTSIVIGPQGTGKTLFCQKLALKMKTIKNVVFATNISAIASHMVKCAKYNVSTICILEDAESSIGQAGSDILNFFDGIDQPHNKLGCYLLMTTNFPDRIEPRILQRPGRVDKIFKFEMLKGEYALKCVEIYLKDYLNDDEKKSFFIDEVNKKKIIEIVSEMSGAQIKGLVDASIAFAVSTNVDVTIDLIAKVKEDMFRNLKDVYEFAKENNLTKRGKLGFNSQNGSNKEYAGIKIVEEVF